MLVKRVAMAFRLSGWLRAWQRKSSCGRQAGIAPPCDGIVPPAVWLRPQQPVVAVLVMQGSRRLHCPIRGHPVAPSPRAGEEGARQGGAVHHPRSRSSRNRDCEPCFGVEGGSFPSCQPISALTPRDARSKRNFIAERSRFNMPKLLKRKHFRLKNVADLAQPHTIMREK